MITIGVSIAIPEPHGEWLRGQRRSFGDAGADHIPSHITLAPPMEVDPSDLDSIAENVRVEASQHQPFTVALGGTGTFRPVSEVVYVVVRQGVPELGKAAGGLTRALNAPKSAFAFHPHVTVAHNVSTEELDRAAADLAEFECEFEVRELTLYVHDCERGWVPVQAFPLG